MTRKSYPRASRSEELLQNSDHLPLDHTRDRRQPYAAEVDDYAGEKAAPPRPVTVENQSGRRRS